MPRGYEVTEHQQRMVLRLLRESYRDGSQVRRSQIPKMTGLEKRTVWRIIDRAAIGWLRVLERAEQVEDMINRSGGAG